MPTPEEFAEAQKLAVEIQVENIYLATRVLPDGSIACLVELVTTRGVTLGVTREGWAKRFCFKDRIKATEQFWALESEDDELEGFIARRPELRNPDGSYVGVKK